MQKPLIIIKTCDAGHYAYVDIQLSWILIRRVGVKLPEFRIEWPSPDYVMDEYVRQGAENAIRDEVRGYCESMFRASV
jgi:hypothetical protein